VIPEAHFMPPIDQGTAVMTEAAKAVKWAVADCVQIAEAPRPARWENELRGKFERLTALKQGWDGSGSVSPDPKIIYRVDAVLRVAFEGMNEAVLPFIVPLADGGLQAEWHRAGCDLEVTFFADGSISALFEDKRIGVETEAEGHEAFDLLLRHARRVAKKDSDAPNVQASTPQFFGVAA